MRPAQLDQLGTFMYQWFIHAHNEEDIPISSSVIMANVIDISKISGDSTFKVRLYRFQCCYSICQLEYFWRKAEC